MNIATPENPIRASWLTSLQSCDMAAFLELLDQYRQRESKAAQTGSMVHEGVAEFHRRDFDKSAGDDAMQGSVVKFPLADIGEARIHYKHYCNDPRNFIQTPYIEEKISITLTPHELDPTQTEIHIKGTLDQLRFLNGSYYLWDLKTGATRTGRDGFVMVDEYCWQQIVYLYGARKRWPEIDIRPGGLICTDSYRVRGSETEAKGVFINSPIQGHTDLNPILDDIRLKIALLRRGIRTATPSKRCRYCPGLSVSNCKYMELPA